MRVYQSYVEGSSEEFNATKDTLKFLGFHIHQAQEHQTALNNGASSESEPVEPWDEKAGRAFTKALNDYPSTHKKVFTKMYEAGQIGYEDLQKKTGMESDKLKASLAALTKLARRDGGKRRPADWTKDGAWAVWEVDPGLRKVIQDHHLL